MILLQIPGKPIPYAHHQGYGRRAYNPRQKEIDSIKKQLKQQYRDAPITSAVIIEMAFFIQPPKSTSKKKREAMIRGDILHTRKPDTSNLYYLYENCLKGIVIKDDSLVITYMALKKWAEKDNTIIKIYKDRD